MSDSGSLNRSAAFASIGVAALLLALKTWAVWSTGSTAMLGSLADTALDLIASMATLLGVWVAAQPDDDNHRFGHGKAEALAAMFQVVLISISALSLAFRSISQWFLGARPQGAEDGIAVSAIAMLAGPTVLEPSALISPESLESDEPDALVPEELLASSDLEQPAKMAVPTRRASA